MKTATLLFLEADGSKHSVEAAIGQSIMEAAIHALVPGILAECGGACACATCHIRVAPEAMGVLPAMSSSERDMLRGAIDPDERSRLACQIPVTGEMDRLVIKLPAQQI